MWKNIMMILNLLLSYAKEIKQPKSTLFRREQIIFSSDFNITKILVPSDGNRYLLTESSDIPSIFFTISDPKLEGGSCIYVLEGLAAYEVLEGGRDATADYNFERTVFFGSHNGLYKYDPNSLSAKRYGPFKDNIIQLQKANGSDSIYILTVAHRIFRIGNHGTVRNRVKNVVCATEFVLDTSDNLYYLDCNDRMPYIVKSDGSMLSVTPSVVADYKEIKLLRPAFIMEKCVPFIADGDLFILYANGTAEQKDFHLDILPSAYSVDAALYLVAALNGKIYEFNLMESLIKSMFNLGSDYPKDITKIVMSVMELGNFGL